MSRLHVPRREWLHLTKQFRRVQRSQLDAENFYMTASKIINSFLHNLYTSTLTVINIEK